MKALRLGMCIALICAGTTQNNKAQEVTEKLEIPGVVGPKVYTNVRVIAVTDKGVKVSHDGGLAVLPLSSLPQEWVAKFAPAASNTLAASPSRVPESSPSSLAKPSATEPIARSKSANTALEGQIDAPSAIVMIEGEITPVKLNPTGAEQPEIVFGSGFIVTIGEASYIYTNAHVLSGLRKARFRTMSGTEIKDLEYLEVSSDKDIFDVARLKLSTLRQDGLRFPDQTWSPNLGIPVVAYGDSGGERAVTELKGSILAVGPGKFETDVDFIPGNSGGPLLILESRLVAGINTAIKDEAVGQATSGTRFAKGRRFSYRADKITAWRKMALDGLVTEHDRVEQIFRDTYTLKTIVELEPLYTRRGFWASSENSLIRTAKERLAAAGGGELSNGVSAAIASVNSALQHGAVTISKSRSTRSTDPFVDRTLSEPAAPLAEGEVRKVYQRFFTTIFEFGSKGLTGITSADYSPFHFSEAGIYGEPTFVKAKEQRAELMQRITQLYQKINSAQWRNER